MGRKTSSHSAPRGLALTVALTLLVSAATPGQDARADDSRDGDRPVVVELFTSQGCNTCPPADALLAELAGDPGVLALSFHVDYWDYIGWKDPFASAQFTERQRDFASKLGLRYVYTPQMVIDGRHDVVGSKRDQVLRAIAKAAEMPPAVTVTLDETAGGRVSLSAGKAPSEGATVWLVNFDDGHDTAVARGENRGRELHNSNVVRELITLGTWSGKAKSFDLDFAGAKAAGRGGCAVIVQHGRGGPILGAAVYDLDAYTG